MNYYAQSDYFDQRLGARSDHNQALRASLFRDLKAHTVLDFGCGTGGVLSRLEASRKIGVEIGDEAAKIAEASGITVYRDIADVPDGTADLAISFHALEHVDDDVSSMLGIYRALKDGGVVRLVVPGELPKGNWRPNPDKHLRTWTPLTFGNLAERAGFRDISARLSPPASGSRGARLFGKPYRYLTGLRFNSFDVILDARK